MKNYFEVGIRYDKELESGKIKAVTENYIVDAVSFTDAEKRMNKEMEAYISGEFLVKTIKRSMITDVHENGDFEYFFKVVVAFSDIDEKSGKEKTTKEQILIKADDLNHAEEIAREKNKDILVPWSIVKCELSSILDYVEYEVELTETEHTEAEAKTRTFIDEVLSTEADKEPVKLCKLCKHSSRTSDYVNTLHCSVKGITIGNDATICDKYEPLKKDIENENTSTD